MRIRKLARTGILTAMALVVFVIESYLPNLTPVPGIKLGLANIFTLFSLYVTGGAYTLLLLIVRVFLGSVFSGQMSVFIYSMAGGLLAFLSMLLLKRVIGEKQLFVVSVFGAIFHNIGQMITAVLLTGTVALFSYLPLLLISGIITGAFTGLACQFTLAGMRKNHALQKILE